MQLTQCRSVKNTFNNNSKFNCGASFEDAIHYFLECPLYLNERRTLLSNCDDININIETLQVRSTSEKVKK
jgi:hypothetical protein